MSCHLGTELKNNFYLFLCNDICGLDCEEICFASLRFQQPDEQVDRTKRTTFSYTFSSFLLQILQLVSL